MVQNRYSDPVSKLLAIGDPGEGSNAPAWSFRPNWPDYQAQYGVTSEHVPELIRLAADETLLRDQSKEKEAWAPIHAWYAMGQLKATEAIEPLLGLYKLLDGDIDWDFDLLPTAMVMFGPAAVQPVAEYLANARNGEWARIAAVETLEIIGNAHPEARAECIRALTSVLQQYTENDALLNGNIVGALAELRVVEAAPLVEQAYKADLVDESVLGDWEDFQVAVGLLEERVTPDEDLNFNPFFPTMGDGYQKQPAKKEDRQVKKKHKQAKDSRKRNRKKKK